MVSSTDCGAIAANVGATFVSFTVTDTDYVIQRLNGGRALQRAGGPPPRLGRGGRMTTVDVPAGPRTRVRDRTGRM